MAIQTLSDPLRDEIRPDRELKHRSWYLVISGVYGLLFFLLFALGSYFVVGLGGSLWYPAAGLRAAVLLIFGWRLAPALAIAEVAAVTYWGMLRPSTRYSDLGEAFLVAESPLVYGFFAFVLLRVVRFDSRLLRVRDMAWFSAFAIAAPIANALGAQVMRRLLSKVPPEDFLSSILGFIIGDSIGLLMLTPLLLLAWHGLRARRVARTIEDGDKAPALTVRLIPDILLIWTFLFVLHQVPVIFEGMRSDAHWYLAFLPMILISFRHGLPGSIAGAAALTSGAAWMFYLPVESIRFHELQILVALLSATSLLMGSAISAQWRTKRQLESRNEALLKARKQVEAKNAELASFNYSVAHDLKNPLVTIKNFLGRLRQDADRGDVDRLRRDLDRVEGAADQMQLMLEELFELSRIGFQNRTLEVVPMTDIVREVVDSLAAPISEADVELVIADDLPFVLGDRESLQNLILHLLRNSLQYFGDQPSPRLEIGCRPTSDGEGVVFFVRDNGIGIADEYHERIFKPFERLSPEDSEGTGLGLTLAKRIVEVHDGRLWVESQGRGQGSTFWFTLPSDVTLSADGSSTPENRHAHNPSTGS